MSFRAKVLLAITTTVAAAVLVVVWVVSAAITRSFERREAERTAAIVAQFRNEFARRGGELARRVEAIAESQVVARIAAQLADPQADLSSYVGEAEQLARAHALDLLELVAPDGAIISSAHWPARFGYKQAWLTRPVDWKWQGEFLKREEIPEGGVLALMSIRGVRAGNGFLYVAGGQTLDQEFLNSLPLSEGMRVLLHRNMEAGLWVQHGSELALMNEQELPASMIADVREQRRELTRVDGDQAITAIPLEGRESELLAVLFVTNSRRDLIQLRREVWQTGAIVGAAGILLGAMLSVWTASRVARPVTELTDTVREVAEGDWSARAFVDSNDEIGQLARNFNRMTEQLVEQKERMLQAERVAAWRELARRLAHELKNPLFPLQITIENLRRAKDISPEQFEEVFDESTATLLTELDHLKQIVGRFSDFAKMPAPQMESVNVNQVVSDVMKLVHAQLTAPDRPAIKPVLDLGQGIEPVRADPEQLRRALRNLVLNAVDAMPAGGTLSVRTRGQDGRVVLEVSDTGQGLTPEECERLFTPYYTTKQHGTGLGLAIVQSVVSDHGGRITLESESGKGATFRIELKASKDYEQTASG